MKKASKYLIVAGSLFAVSGAHAAANGTLNTSLLWDTLSVTTSGGASFGRASVPPAIPGDIVPANLSADSYSWWGYESSTTPYTENEVSEYGTDPNSYVVSYNNTVTTPEINMTAGYAVSSMENYSHTAVDNNSMQWLVAESSSDMGLIYYAESAGTVEISLGYTVDGSVTTDGLNDFADNGYYLGLWVGDLTTFVGAYTEGMNNGMSQDEAEDYADILADMGGQEVDSAGNWLESSNGGDAEDDLVGTLSFGFEVEAGRYYFIGAEAGGWVYTQASEASPVPVPAAVWLFGSGLVGLVGIGRRRKV